MQMEVLVRIDMIQAKTTASKRLQLRPNFRRNLPPRCRVDEDLDTAFHQPFVHEAVATGECRNPARGESRSPVREHEMQSDAKIRQPLSPADRVGGRRR